MRYLPLAALLVACRATPVITPSQGASPGSTVPLMAVARSALRCLDGTVSFTVQEFGGGTVDAGGNYTAPPCGPYVPGVYHVLATGCGESATLTVEVQESVLSVAVCGVPTGATCCSPNVLLGPGGTTDFYATVTWECPGHVTYSPSQPPPSCP